MPDLLGNWWSHALRAWVEVLSCRSGTDDWRGGICHVSYPDGHHDLWASEVEAKVVNGHWTREAR